VRDVEPGELVIVDETGLHSSRFADAVPRLAQCVFEMVYFARPDSNVFGANVHMTRFEYGRALAREQGVEADVVTAIPDSGNSAALGFSQESGIPFNFGFIRNHYVGRTFIMPEMEARIKGVDMKLAVLPDVVNGKRVVVVDDSIIRGTTVRHRVTTLREAGAREVHVRISCPPTRHPCHYGIDFPTSEELIAGHQDVEAVRAFIGADSLGYLSIEGLLAPYENGDNFCTACFSGDYPVAPYGVQGKNELEMHAVTQELNFATGDD